jgi:hypothetical protein
MPDVLPSTPRISNTPSSLTILNQDPSLRLQLFFINNRRISTMKLSNTLLALCVFHFNVWGTDAFFNQAPKKLTTAFATRATDDYLRSLNGEQARTLNMQNSNVSDMFASMEKAAAMEKTGGKSPLSKPISTKTADTSIAKSIWKTASPMLLQGGSLRTWSETTGSVKRVQVSMITEGRPLNANIELWHGPDNTPLKMEVYSEDGIVHPFNFVIETPTGQNTIAIRNTGEMEFPLAACVETDVEDVAQNLADMGGLKTIQGGAIHTYPFDHSVGSVQILLMTGGRPLNAKIELLQGPNNDKQVIDIYTEDGMLRPFFAVIDTPGTGNVIRIVNTATVEFPMTCSVLPYTMEEGGGRNDSSGRGWDNGGGQSSSFLPRGR